MLEDIAILTGAEVITEEMGLKLENTKLTQLGRARKVVVDKDSTTLIDGAGESDAIKSRIKQLKAEIENTDSDFDREKLQERLAKLAGGVAVVKVGAATETEMKEKKHASRTRCRPLARPSRRASSRAAASRCSTPSRRSSSTASRATSARAPRSSWAPPSLRRLRLFTTLPVASASILSCTRQSPQGRPCAQPPATNFWPVSSITSIRRRWVFARGSPPRRSQ